MERAASAGTQMAETSEGGKRRLGGLGGMCSRLYAALVSDAGEDWHSAAARRGHRHSRQRTRRQSRGGGKSKRCRGAGGETLREGGCGCGGWFDGPVVLRCAFRAVPPTSAFTSNLWINPATRDLQNLNRSHSSHPEYQTQVVVDTQTQFNLRDNLVTLSITIQDRFTELLSD